MAGGDQRIVWLTGFAPFAGYRTNPSGLIAKALDGARIGSTGICGRVLPVSLARNQRAVDRLKRLPPPAAIVALGLAPGTAGIRLERVAANWIEFSIADSDGVLPVPQPVAEDGPAALWSTLPVDAIRADCVAVGIPAFTSMTAGTYLCNVTLYRLLRLAESLPGRPPCGFIHLPFTPEEAARPRNHLAGLPQPSMTLDLQRKAVEVALRAILRPTRPRRPPRAL